MDYFELIRSFVEWLFTRDLIEKIIAAIIGGVVSFWFALRIFLKTKEKERDDSKKFHNRILIAIRSEIKSLDRMHNATLGPILDNLEDQKPLLFWYEISQNYFVVFESNASNLGKIEAKYSTRIIELYSLMKSFVEDFRVNRHYIQQYELAELSHQKVEATMDGSRLMAVVVEREKYIKEMAIYENQMKSYLNLAILKAKTLKEKNAEIRRLTDALMVELDTIGETDGLKS